MPPKGKKNAANQHDKRHESGLAAPGKRITKQRSNTNLNGNGNGKPLRSATPPPLPSTGLNQGITFPRPVTSSTETATPNAIGGSLAATQGREQQNNGTRAHGSGEARDTGHMAGIIAAEPSSNEPRCGTETNGFKTVTSQASSKLALAATILSSCPLRDAIAILILLLSLPPTLVITIHTLFASLTFVPPTAISGISWNFWVSKPSLSDWFHATAAGGPSLFVISIMDTVVTLVYLCSPISFQNVYLDFAQAVIAISLSGAAAGKGGPANSVAACSVIISIVQLFRLQSIHITGLHWVQSLLHNMGFGGSDGPPPAPNIPSYTPSTHGWARLFLGCHILAQGIVTLVRRALAGSGNPARVSKRQDPEAASSVDGPRASLSAGETGPDTTSNSSTDGRPPGLPPAVREGEKRISSNKKKRKQANQVRSQQPLWAAVASTKVTFLKEMEQKQTSNDEVEVQAMSIRNAGIATLEDTVCVTDLQPTEICFRADVADSPTQGELDLLEEGNSVSAGIDKSKPLYVRINGADWVNTAITRAAMSGGVHDKTNTIWDGRIYGLTPLTSYSCEFVRFSDQKVLGFANLITLPAPSTEQASAVSAPPQPQALRPASPISTLKQSLAAAEVKLADAKNRLKRSKREHKNATSGIRKEIDQLKSKVESSGGTDERQKGRILQLTRDIAHNNEAADEAEAEAEALGEIPEDDIANAEARRRAWQAVCDRRKAALEDLENVKAEANREAAQLNADVIAAAQKRERQTGRQAKLNENHDRLIAEKNADRTARQQHEFNRSKLLQERQAQENDMRYWIEQSKVETDNLQYKMSDMWSQMEQMQRNLAQHASMSSPTTPEGNLPGTLAGTNGRQPPGFDNYAMFGGFTQGQGSDTFARGGGGGRGRSSSMLSGYSGFTEDLEEAPQNGGFGEQGRNRSNDSSGSGSTGSSDAAASPRAAVTTPIGPPTRSGPDGLGRGKQPMSPMGGNW